MSRFMVGNPKEDRPGVFGITPHKIAVCQIIQFFAPPGDPAIPIPFQSISQHNRVGLFLLSVTRSYDDFVEPPLDELINQLKAAGGLVNICLSEHLKSSLSTLSSPDDLFNFFDKLRGVLATPEGACVEYDQIFLDPNSHLGVFLRCCILAFNLLNFEGVCHLLTNIGAYCNSTDSTYELLEEDDFNNDSVLHELLENEDLDMESAVFQKYGHAFEAETSAGESSALQIHAPRAFYGLVEDFQVSVDGKFKHSDDGGQSSEFISSLNNAFRGDDHQGFLRSKWQVEGYLNMQADFLEKYASSLPLNSFDAILKQLRKLAPELHRVQYLQYLNGLYHDDYLAALDNLHCYFDYRDGRNF